MTVIDRVYRREFVDGYIKAALWSSTDESDESGGRPLDEQYEASDIVEDSLKRMARECMNFIDMAASDLEQAEDERRSEPMGAELAGHNFWLTRNGHGSGFWDTDMGPVGKRLTKMAHTFGPSDLYVGDDQKLHVYP